MSTAPQRIADWKTLTTDQGKDARAVWWGDVGALHDGNQGEEQKQRARAELDSFKAQEEDERRRLHELLDDPTASAADKQDAQDELNGLPPWRWATML
ncbi:hypothetical protein JCM10450v2_005978 [Rhodotorula kratochvilovae]